MKLVLLPGMDGTGLLFEDFVSAYPGDCEVIALPDDTDQDYTCLSKIIAEQLPDEDFILLAESFSGGLVPHLLKLCGQRIKGVIFVASFISCPNRVLLPLARYLPLTKMASLPLAGVLQRHLLVGWDADKDLIKQLQKVMKSVPVKTLKQRAIVMQKMKLPCEIIDTPAVYIHATWDRLVKIGRYRDITKVFSNIKLFNVNGPHMILQTKTQEAEKAVSQAIEFINTYS